MFNNSLEGMHATLHLTVQTKLGQGVDQKLLLLNINSLDILGLPVTVSVTAPRVAEIWELWNIVKNNCIGLQY